MSQKELNIWLHSNPHQNKQAAKQHTAAILQQQLKRYSGQSEDFIIHRNVNGKPYTQSGPHFSYSHSAHLLALAIDDNPIGIDIEIIKPERNFKAIAKRHYHEEDCAAWALKPETEQQMAFFRQWSAKEAWCKFDGGILWHYLPQAVSACPQTIQWIPWIQGFTCAVASDTVFQSVRLNVLA